MVEGLPTGGLFYILAQGRTFVLKDQLPNLGYAGYIDKQLAKAVSISDTAIENSIHKFYFYYTIWFTCKLLKALFPTNYGTILVAGNDGLKKKIQ
tara:strand:+ start:679 stop:963 length:285 start_codon:yes stop_codon:yes gene_type:complete